MTNKMIIGVYDDEGMLMSSIRQIQEKGFTINDVYSPYPIHEVFEALKIKTRLPLAAFLYSTFGMLATFAFLYWTSVVNYPLVFGGKPQNTLSFVVILFVMIINIGCLFTIITFFVREKKYPGVKPEILHPGVTDDKYLIVIQKDEKLSKNDLESINTLLKNNGAIEITEK
ncbi:MAG: DUF3341 domain-containing protein [Bacteroidetes bacterium]|nr:DUF3341 domain-containing protein [Bacteroidota bacterium]